MFGNDVMSDLKKDAGSFFQLCRGFESVKRKVNFDTKRDFTISFPFVALSKYCKNHEKELETVITSSPHSQYIRVKNGHLRIDAEFFRGLFKPTLDKLAHVLKNVFARELVQDVSNIILVGGFAECELVQKRIQDTFPSQRIIVPEECGLSVLKGAVMYGHNPSCIGVRVVPFTYGISVAKPFNGSLHDRKHAFVHNGKMYRKRLFEKLVEQGTDVKTENRIVKQISTAERLIYVNLYLWKNKDPTYVDENDCSLIKTSFLNIKNLLKKNRSVSLIFKFGETEISVTTEDASDEEDVPDIMLSE